MPPPKAPTAPPPSASALTPGAPTVREGALLLEARRALDSDPARALSLVHEHEQEFPTSQLAPERFRIEREATKRLGGH